MVILIYFVHFTHKNYLLSKFKITALLFLFSPTPEGEAKEYSLMTNMGSFKENEADPNQKGTAKFALNSSKEMENFQTVVGFQGGLESGHQNLKHILSEGYGYSFQYPALPLVIKEINQIICNENAVS